MGAEEMIVSSSDRKRVITFSTPKRDGAGDEGKGGSRVQRTEHRMAHNIPHRTSAWLCTPATRCSVCLTMIRFASRALRCSECPLVCHQECKSSLENTCGLPESFLRHYKEGVPQSTFSPIGCSILKGDKKKNYPARTSESSMRQRHV